MTGRRAAAAADAVVMVCINLSGARAAPRRQHGSHLALSRRPAGRVPGAAAQRPVVHRHAAAAASVPARHLASILGRIDADDRRRIPGERRSGRSSNCLSGEQVETSHVSRLMPTGAQSGLIITVTAAMFVVLSSRPKSSREFTRSI